MRAVGAVLCACAFIACAPSDAVSRGLILRGFNLVDVGKGEVRFADIVVEEGKVRGVAAVDSYAGERYRIVDGNGRWLLPAFWDLNAFLVGNSSATGGKRGLQPLGITGSSRAQLYYGVAHVVASGMPRQWMDRELKRSAALEFAAAEIIHSDLAVCGRQNAACSYIRQASDVPLLLDELHEHGVQVVQVHFEQERDASARGISPDTLKSVLHGAAQRSMRSYVLVDTWQEAEEAVRLGANAVHGLPRGVLSNELIALMQKNDVAYAPALSRTLELNRIVGNVQALGDPFLSASVPRWVLTSFEDAAELWRGWRGVLEAGRAVQEQALNDMLRLSTGGVRLVSATDAGRVAGAFQGYSAHATQAWMEIAGVETWARLRALTTWPAEFMDRRSGFEHGDPADFVALESDPTLGTASLRQISFVVRDGQLVEPTTLQPDVSRMPFAP